MKLIDLLVQELPKRGGWPDGAACATQDKDGEVCFSEGETPEFGLTAWHDGDWCGNEFRTITATDYDTAIITRAQYESALAASKKPAWNGEGLPHSGVECEARLRCDDGEWFFFRCVGVDCGVAFGWAGKEAVTLGKGSYEFRPLRTQAERKRDAAIEAMQREADEGNNWVYSEYEIIYDAIAAGKIPGVKLEE